jgi:GlpG protein
VLHIIFNLLWWSDLGRLIERFQSSFQLIWITLLVAAVSNLAQFMDTGPRFGGLSGVVYGLLGYLWLYGKTNPAAGYQLRREIVILMLVWLVICYVGLADIVANAAHVSGLITGAALGAGIGLYRRARYYKGG